MVTLPSGAEAGLDVKPFRGIRYAPNRVGDIADVTSPPYDVISSGVLSSLLDASPYNSVRLTLPGPETGGPRDAPTAGALAARRLGEWLRSGALVRDPSPGMYIYEQNGSSRLQRGLITLVRVGSPAAAGIFPHEAVMPGPVAGRRSLMTQTRANLEPILLVYNGGSGSGGRASGGGARGAGGPTASWLVDMVAEGSPPLAEAVTGDGVSHRLWALTDPGAHAAVAADLSGRTALIADGHHRYAAYRELRDSMDGPGPWDYGLAFLVDADTYPPQLGAIHRVVPGLSGAEAARRASAAFTVRELPDDFGPAMARLADAGRDGGHAFALASPEGYWLLTRPDATRLDAAMPAGTSSRWRSLDAAVLRELLFAELWGITDNEHDVLISHDAPDAVEMARSTAGTAVLCNPVPFTAVRDIAAVGECVPRKSTSFGPKPRTGLVFRTFDD